MKEDLFVHIYTSCEVIYDSLCTYGTEIILIFLLSLITIYRREMSCNAVYLEGRIKNKPLLISIEKNLESHSEWDKPLNPSESRGCPLLDLPQDVQISCLSYLHPGEIINLSSVNRQTHDMIHEENGVRSFSSILWYQIFLRDYALVITKWKYGIDAVDRLRDMHWNVPKGIASLLGKDDGNIGVNPATPTMKEFYLMFGLTWVDFTIAGRTESPTLVGIHGHVFNMTTFLNEHPGSPETIITMGGGRDVTSFFEARGHSMNARSIALKRLVEIVDLSRCKCGDGNQILVGLTEKTDNIDGILPLKRTETRIPNTLHQLRLCYDRDRRIMKKEATLRCSMIMSKRGEMNVLGSMNIYFDPLCYCWKAWYLDLDFKPVFIHDMSGRPLKC